LISKRKKIWMSITWPDIALDLRKAMIAAGTAPHDIDSTLAELRPIVVAVERAGSRVSLYRVALNARSRSRRIA
jgi:hypothetical protein